MNLFFYRYLVKHIIKITIHTGRLFFRLPLVIIGILSVSDRRAVAPF